MEVKGGKDETDAGGAAAAAAAADEWVGAFQFGRSPGRPCYKPDEGKRKKKVQVQERIGREVGE